MCIAHRREHAHASNALLSLTRAACCTATVCSLQTQAGAAAGQATPVICTKVPTTHFTIPQGVEG